jgi:DNA-directed RNA polymerase subunit M
MRSAAAAFSNKAKYCMNWALAMFCPQCGTLAFPSPSGDISCTNYKCGYNGPANLVIKGTDGKDVDLSKAKSSTNAKSRVYDVIKDSDKRHGVLTTNTYMCPNRIDGTPCDCIEVYSYLEQTRSSDEPETRMLTCKECGHGWREY